MRWAGPLVIVVGLFGAPAASAKSSNPAFLGIGMQDVGHTQGAGPCEVSNVEPGTGAEEAGIQPSDVLVALDGKLVSNCDSLVSLIQMRVPGDVITLDVHRTRSGRGLGVKLSLKARLSSRDELMRRRLVGLPLPAARLVNVENRMVSRLGAGRQGTTIVGWFSTRCEGCDRVFADLARRTRTITRGAPVEVLAATEGDEHKSLGDNLELLKLQARRFDVPLLVADPEIYQRFTFKDRDRIHFMVLDRRGVVQYVAPIAPDADDTDALLDELHAAAEQATRRTK